MKSPFEAFGPGIATDSTIGSASHSSSESDAFWERWDMVQVLNRYKEMRNGQHNSAVYKVNYRASCLMQPKLQQCISSAKKNVHTLWLSVMKEGVIAWRWPLIIQQMKSTLRSNNQHVMSKSWAGILRFELLVDGISSGSSTRVG